MLSLLPINLPKRQLQHLVLRVDHEIQIALLNTHPKIALLIKKVRHQVQFFTKRVTHFLMNGSLGSTWRVGGAQDLLNSGASLPQIMVKGGWAKADTVIRYVERTRPASSIRL